MICKNCNTENNAESRLCTKCGANLLNEEITQTIVETVPPQGVQAASPLASKLTNIGNIILSYLMYAIAVLMNPFKAYKEEENKFADTKTTLIFGASVAGAMTFIKLIKAMIAGVFVKVFDYSTFKTKTEIDFSNLKNLDYVELIFKNLLIYAGVIVLIALVYYLVALIFKKSLNFIKLISISATAILPYVVLGMIASSILGEVWFPLAVLSLIVGVIYSIVILVNLMNEEVKLENGDIKIYYHTICISVLVSVLCYLIYQLVLSSLGGALSLLR